MTAWRRALVVGGGLAVLAGCASPEATRARAGGPGADVGNRGAAVQMHEGSHPYWNTPRVAGVEGTALEPARQAARFSAR
jgi:hypothetical protein